MGKLIDQVLDTSVYFSFDRTGFERHQQDFVAGDLDVDLSSKRILVTGANSGLGRSAAHSLAALGAEVRLLCRSESRGRIALDDIRFATGNERVRLEIVDMSDLGSIRAFVERMGDENDEQEPTVDVVIHNAGVLPPTRELTADGLEVTWATNVVGPFLLTALLMPHLRRAADPRVINVTSGGMYTQRLDLEDTQWAERPFDGVTAYAQTKRAEVVLTELWAERLGFDGIAVHAMHPGWADTPSVRQALPTFWRFTRNRLRTPRQGADTIVWLAACERLRDETGKLYFDRRAVKTHLLPGTRESNDDRRRLWELCCKQAGLDETL